MIIASDWSSLEVRYPVQGEEDAGDQRKGCHTGTPDVRRRRSLKFPTVRDVGYEGQKKTWTGVWGYPSIRMVEGPGEFTFTTGMERELRKKGKPLQQLESISILHHYRVHAQILESKILTYPDQKTCFFWLSETYKRARRLDLELKPYLTRDFS